MAGDFANDPTKPVRARLLRRIAERRICGSTDTESGRPCLATPLTPGGRCEPHGGTIIKAYAEKRGPGSVLTSILSACMSPEDAKVVQEIYKYGPCTLEDQIALTRLRILDLERRFRDGYLLLDAYGKELRSLTEQLRKLTVDNSKIALNQALADRFETPEAEEYDPFRYVGRTPAEGE